MKIPPPGASSGRSREPHAGELFTDRVDEATAFKNTLVAFRRLLDEPAEPAVARHNALVFHGVGGVGKSTLSARLAGWVTGGLPLANGWGPKPLTEVDACVRIDLHASVGQVDLVEILLEIRQGLGKIKAHWPLFDFAFAAYWSAVAPGAPLPLSKSGFKFGDVLEDTVASVIQDLDILQGLEMLGTTVGLGVKGVRWAIVEMQRRRRRLTALKAYDGYEDFVIKCADEPTPNSPRPDLLLEIANHLSYELATYTHTRTPLVIVFVDTTERLHMDKRRVAEYLLNGLVYNLPNVLFVMTGRNKLDWFDAHRTDLYIAGSSVWPGLIPGAADEPHQHLVGKLSTSDSRDFMRRSSRLLDLRIPDPVIDQVVASSGGLPQYLELAKQVALNIRDSGDRREVTIDDVDGSLGDLVVRVLDDVPDDERRAIFAAALFPNFNASLVSAAAGTDHGCAARALLRPMIDFVDGGRYPYRMHDEIRHAIRTADHQVSGGWDAMDWGQAATRAVAEARRVHGRAVAEDDGRGVLESIGVAVGVVCAETALVEPSDSEAYDDWLTKAIVYAPSIAGLAPLVPTDSRTDYGDYVLRFIRGKTPSTPVSERLALLESVFRSHHPLAIPAGRHLAYALRTRSEGERALQVFDELLERRPSDLHRRERAQTLTAMRRFKDALASSTGLPEEEAIQRVVAYAHGDIDETYFSDYTARVEQLRLKGRRREFIEERGTLLVRRTILRGDTGLEEIDRHYREAEAFGHMIGARDGLLAGCLHPNARSDTVSAARERLIHLDRIQNEGDLGFRSALALALEALVAGDADTHARLREEVEGRKHTLSRAWIPFECLMEIAGAPLIPRPTQWVEPRQVVVDRWRAYFEGHVRRVRSRRVW